MIDEAQLASALEEHRCSGRRLGQVLLALHLVDEETLVRTLARQLSVPVVWLRGKRIRGELLELLPRELIEKRRCLPVLLDERGAKTLLVAMEDPSDAALIDEIARCAQLPVKPVIASPSEIEDAIERHLGPGATPLPVDLWDTDLCQPDLLRMTPTPSRQPSLLPPLPPLPSVDGSPDGVPNATGNERVLRVLTQILIEKGILTRDELVLRLGEPDAASDPDAT